jgi:murein DD-endopeptidase MepM/ murein hydrolase activator NlpD
MSEHEEPKVLKFDMKRFLARMNLRNVRAFLREIDFHRPSKRLVAPLLLIMLIAIGAWATHLGLTTLPENPNPEGGVLNIVEAGTATTVPDVAVVDLPVFAGGSFAEGQVQRLVNVHTILPSRPRLDVIQYEVKEGDSLFGIAGYYGLKPESILWGNFDVLQDNPHSLQPEQVLNIPPVDGTLHTWAEGESLNGIAEYYNVTVNAILDWPGNNLSPDIDLDAPSIKAGTQLIIPGGARDFVDWSAPRITRANPSVARILGPGYCGEIYDGPIGYGSFIWPTPLHYLSGYDYSPETNHYAIDIAGDEGHSIYASDAGVVVYSGWHNGGYGNVIVLDHGNGWQTLYAHLSVIYVGCGDGVFQGTTIGLMGSTGRSTGPHLHFEMRHDIYGKVNPWNYLP